MIDCTRFATCSGLNIRSHSQQTDASRPGGCGCNRSAFTNLLERDGHVRQGQGGERRTEIDGVLMSGTVRGHFRGTCRGDEWWVRYGGAWSTHRVCSYTSTTSWSDTATQTAETKWRRTSCIGCMERSWVLGRRLILHALIERDPKWHQVTGLVSRKCGGKPTNYIIPSPRGCYDLDLGQ